MSTFLPFSLEGVGVHTGRPCRTSVAPATSGVGIVFTTGTGEIQAVASAIDPLSVRSTNLTSGSSKAGMVEHLLAALLWYGVKDARIDMEGPEIPILDGSALPWANALTNAGAHPSPHFVEIEVETEVVHGDSVARISPCKEPSIAIYLQYDEIDIGSRQMTFAPMIDDFVEILAPARTFALESEVEQILASGLGLGGSLENALIIGESGPLNPGGFRFDDEPVRHKMLDVIGDLALLGGLPLARLDIIRPGHRIMHELVRRVIPGTAS